MSRQDKQGPKPEKHTDLGEELRMLAEAVLERAEPALRAAATGVGKEVWANCDWCPVCAAAALLRGEHHDFLGILADHGTNIVVVLREALAGVPVEPKLPAEAKPASADPQPAEPDSHRLVNIPVTIKAETSTDRRSSGHNSTPWTPVV